MFLNVLQTPNFTPMLRKSRATLWHCPTIFIEGSLIRDKYLIAFLFIWTISSWFFHAQLIDDPSWFTQRRQIFRKKHVRVSNCEKCCSCTWIQLLNRFTCTFARVILKSNHLSDASNNAETMQQTCNSDEKVKVSKSHWLDRVIHLTNAQLLILPECKHREQLLYY